MPFNQENYRKIRQEYETKYINAREDANRRRSEVEMRFPEIAQIHREMSGIGLEIMQASLRSSTPAERETAIATLKQKNLDLQKKRADILTAAGYPADYTEIHYACTNCGDTGFLDNGAMCSCMREKLICAGYASSGLGALLGEQRFDNFSLDYFRQNEQTYRTMSLVYKTLYNYATHFSVGSDTCPPSENLLLVGGTGLGKTHLSTAVAKTILDKGFDVFYTSAVGMVAAFETERFGTSAAGDGVDTARLDRFYQCDLLILDDLGTEVANQFTVSCLYNVINTRLNLRRPTIINTNLMQEELRHRYWDRITSRLFGEYRILLFLGTDIRAQKIRAGGV